MKKILILSFLLALSACNDSTQKSSDNSSRQKDSQNNQTTAYDYKHAEKIEVEYSDIAAFKALSITEGLFENAPALLINLSLPIDESQAVSQHIQVTTNKQSVNGEWIYSANRMSLYFPFIQAETSYSIRIDKQLLSVNGKQIDKDYTKNITTKRKQKSVRFVSKGSTLLKDSNKLPIEAVNVDAVDLKFWRIKADKYSEFLRNPYRRDIYYLRDLPDTADLVYTAQFALEMHKNKTETHNLSLKAIKPLQQAGIYFVTMVAADSYKYEVESSWFAVTDIGLHSRQYPKSLAVFAHQLPAAKAYGDVKLELLNDKGMVLETQTTDKDGYAEFKGGEVNKANLIVATHGSNSNLIRLSQAKMDLSEFPLSNRGYKTQELFLYAPRDLYRPGEQVNINALLRDDDGQMVLATPVRVEVKRPDNRTYKTFNWQGDENSFYHTEFALPKDAMTGAWQFQATLASKELFKYEFSVEDFMPERLKLELETGNSSLHIGRQETPIIKVQSDYLYGSPASKNRFDATATVSAETHLFEQYQDYVFGSSHYKDYDLNFTTKSQLLNEQGYGEISIIPNWQEAQFPLRISSFVNVYESGGRPISRRIKQTVWPYETAVGIRKLWEGDYASPNSNNEVELIAINKQGEKVTLNNAEVLLIRENSQRYWHWGDDGWSYNQSERNLPVYSRLMTLKADVINSLSLPLDYGNYRLEIRDQSQQLISSYRFFSGWRWYDQSASNGERPDQIKLQWQADSLTPGTEADLKITAPYAGTLLLTVESDQLLWKKTLQMDSAEQTIKIPVDSDWKRHDLHTSVMVIQKGETKRKHLPTRAFGVIHMPLNRDDRKLEISIENPEKTLPDRAITLRVKAENFDSSKATFLTLAAVDTGVLNVSNFDTPKPHHWFFAARKYIAEIRDIYGFIIALSDGKDARQKFGGDADAELARGGDEPSSDVQIVSLLSEKIQFDDNGIAEVTFKLPYFNGEVRLMAMAFNDNQFAGVDSRMKIAAPVVIETSLPRFIAKDDQTVATVDIHNTEKQEQTINLQIIASDALGGEISEQKLVLAANEKQVIKLPITAQLHQGTGSITVIATMKRDDAFTINRQWNIGLRPAYPAVINSMTKVIDSGQNLTLPQDLSKNMDQSNLKSVLKISKTPVLNAEQQLKQLIQYPYGCLEQTTSRAWPLMLVEKADFDLFDSLKQSKIYQNRDHLIEGAISRLLGMQRYDGSFGLWNSDSAEEYWLSVYVTEFLIKAKSLAYNVPEKPLAKAIKRLQYYVKGRVYLNSDLSRYLSNANNYKLSYRAYAAYVLATVKQVNLQDIRKMYDSKSKTIKSPLPLAYMAMALETMGDGRRAREAWSQAIDFKWQEDRYGYHGDYGSKIRDLSQIILLGLSSNIATGLPQSSYQLLKPLQDEMRKRRWLSTQERGAIFRVAKALKTQNKLDEKWQATLAIAEQPQSYTQATDLIKVWHDQQVLSDKKVQNTGDMPLYIDYKTQGYPTKAEPQSNGITVSRHYFNLQGDKIDLSNVMTGDMILVHIEIGLQKKYTYLPDALLVELLPAGLELENQNLEHSMKLDEIIIDGQYIEDWMENTSVIHSEYRDDRFIAALALSRYNKNHLFYLARAVTPGTYTIPPSLVEDMYRPEIRAIGDDDGRLKIVEK